MRHRPASWRAGIAAAAALSAGTAPARAGRNALAKQATPRFLESKEAKHRTPALEKLRRGRPTAAAASLPLLRRAKIIFTRTETTPVKRQVLDKCPATLEQAVRAFLDARRGRRRGGQP
jgi:hypothetical protein